LFDNLAASPAMASEFNAFMVAQTRASVRAILEAYSFEATRVLADIGGGHGALLAGVLKAHPRIAGVLYDLPQVIASAGEAPTAVGVQDRCTILPAISFGKFPPVPTRTR